MEGQETEMREVSRKKRVIYNSAASGLYQVILTLSGLILPRFILVAYGSSYNGLVASLCQFLGITEILTMGLAGTARVELYDSIAHKDIRRTSGIVKAISRYMYKAAGIFLAYMVLLIFIYPMFEAGDFNHWEIISLIFIIGIGNILSYVFGYAYNVLLDADNTTYYYTLLRAFLTIANVIISVALIRDGYSIQTVKLASGIIFAVAPLVLSISVPRIYKLDRKAPVENKWRKNQKYAAASSIALIVHENTDIVILTILTSAKIVSVYSVYNLAIKGLKGILSVFTSSMEPFFGDMWAKKEFKEMGAALTYYEYFIGFFSSVSLSGALGLILPFVELYTKGVTDIEYVIPLYAFVAVLAELARCIRIPYSTVTQAAGKYKETQNGAFLEAGLNILTSIILTVKFGIVGVAVGTLIANLFRTFNYSWFVSRHLLCRDFKRTFFLLAWSLFNIIINSLVFSIIYFVIGLSFTSWVDWVTNAVVIVLLSMGEVLTMSVIFYKSEFKWMVRIVQKNICKFINR